MKRKKLDPARRLDDIAYSVQQRRAASGYENERTELNRLLAILREAQRMAGHISWLD